MAQKNLDSDENMSSINSKEWLNLAWNYFQQHAQQRISYFNFFVVFSTILTAGLLTTFQNDFKATYLGIAIGLIESFVSFIFLKIDSRNKMLTKSAENVIMRIEKDFDDLGKKSYKLFTDEATETVNWQNKNKGKLFYSWNLTHGQSYKIIYITFFFIGILMSITSIVIAIEGNTTAKEIPSTNYYNYKIKQQKKTNQSNIDSLPQSSQVVCKKSKKR